MYPRMLFPNGEWDGVSEVETVTVSSKEEEAAQALLGFLPIWPADDERPAGKAPKIVPAAPPPGYDDKKIDRRRKEYRDASRNDADQ